MTSGEPSRWQEAKAVLNEVLDLSPAEQADAVDRACAGDEALRAEVLSLLRAWSAGPDVVGRLEKALNHAMDARDGVDPRLGTTLEGYRLEALLGRGGMGAVYRGRPPDGGPEVAIKLLDSTSSSGFALRRFDLERDRLSQLDHPLIASFLASGSTTDGDPYLIMELVDGEPIDTYCDRHRLRVQERVEILMKVCEAVEHAHRHQVIHRDLKPSNILVRPSGRPALLDFGIAKLLDPARGGAASTLTFEARAFTPTYASPEQACGQAVSPASDVYSLGAVGYLLMAGGPPRPKIGLEQRSPREVLDDDDERMLEVASARSTKPGRLQQWLEGDLGAVLFRACEPVAEKRYPTVAELRRALGRCLPVAQDRTRSVFGRMRGVFRPTRGP